MAVLSAYEQLRDKKIAENRAKLEELGLGDAASSLKAPKRPRPKKKSRAAF